MRVVEVWMEGEFKEFFYTREPWLRGAPYGDISEQLKMKKEKKCKSFAWFMENIAYDVYDKFPKLPPNVAWGEVRNYFITFLHLLLNLKVLGINLTNFWNSLSDLILIYLPGLWKYQIIHF